jgi:hypothetical protein
MTSPATNTARRTDEGKKATAAIAAAHEALVRDSFDDIALLVGSAASIYNLDDDILWTVMKRLDRIRVRLLRDLNGNTGREDFEPTPVRPPRTHPAVDEFLARNRAGMGESAA